MPDADFKPELVPEGHVVVVPTIQETGTDRGKTVTRGYEHIIGKPLPLAPVPDLASVRAALLFEFPYARGTVDRLLADLVGRTQATLRPTLLVGPPGAGKSRLGARLAHHLGLVLWRVDATTTPTTTTRSWRPSCWPADPVTTSSCRPAPICSG